MTQTYHITGPPGTGKTTHLARQATSAINKYGSKSTLICSLTKAAAHEIAGRGIPIADDMIGTLHAHCYRALGMPKLAEANIVKWNEEHPTRELTTMKSDVNDSRDSDSSDSLLARINIRRANMDPVEVWPLVESDFYELWCEWKEENELMDFTDLIETCINDVRKAPGDPSVMLGDEAQDWSKIEFKLFCDTWGQHADTIALSGDFDQTLYSWRAADPYYFINNPVPEENRRVLAQSYRVPRTVHDKAHAWIRQIREREDIDYHPRDEDGEVLEIDAKLGYLDPLIDDMEQRLKDGKTCMILTTCSYLLNRVTRALKEARIPFGNSFRKQNAAWNPLGRRRNATMPVDRLASFLAPRLYKGDDWRQGTIRKWTADEFRAWIDLLESSKCLNRGAKTIIKEKSFLVPESFGYFMQLFKTEQDAHSALDLDIDWLRAGMGEKKAKLINYVIDIVNSWGEEYLTKKPPVTVGTIHSVKGGEADTVYLFPDMSRQGMESWESDGERKNNIIRTFYVGMTRAKESLVICQPSSNLNVEL